MTLPDKPPKFHGLPGSVDLSHLTVYDSQGPDGEHGGSPHLHLASSEAYIVLSGAGRVQTLSHHGFLETSLRPLQVVWFSPGTVHRLINDGGLEIIVMMANQGLPEAGDAVITFPAPYRNSIAEYEAATALPSPGSATNAEREQAAQQRRDLAIEGFLELRRAFERVGEAALDDLYRQAAALVQARLPRWRQVVAETVVKTATDTADLIDRLAAGDITHLTTAQLRSSHLESDGQVLGMCGRLAPLALSNSNAYFGEDL
jgi:mannose-6-phosphate isomerase-like protein (cupin superfamily)